MIRVKKENELSFVLVCDKVKERKSIGPCLSVFVNNVLKITTTIPLKGNVNVLVQVLTHPFPHSS
jgi:hypothetical protein